MGGKAGRERRRFMDILLVMCLGILVGRFLFPQKAKRWNEGASLLCTLVLIFSMGAMLGRKEGFLHQLLTLGAQSFLFFLIPTVLSIVVVYVLTRRFMKRPNQDKKEEEA